MSEAVETVTPAQDLIGAPSPLSVWTRRAIIAWAVVGMGIVAWAGLQFFVRIGEALVPLLVGGIIAFLIRPLARLFMKWGLHRGLAVLFTFLVVVAVLGVAAWILVPPVLSSFGQLVAALPQIWNEAQAYLSKAVADMKSLPSPVQNAINQALSNMGATIQQVSQQILQFILAAGGSAMGLAFNIFLGFILAIWFLLDGAGISKWVVWVTPDRWRDDMVAIGHAFTDSFGGYLRGTVINMTITFLGCGVGFMLIKMPYGWAIALAIGILAVIPYIGPILGGLIAALIGLLAGGPVLGVLALVVVIAVEQAVDSVISPIVMGKSVSLHPVAIITALGVGGALAGFFGIIMAIPVAAALYTLYLYYRGKIDPDFKDDRNDPYVPTDPNQVADEAEAEPAS